MFSIRGKSLIYILKKLSKVLLLKRKDLGDFTRALVTQTLLLTQHRELFELRPLESPLSIWNKNAKFAVESISNGLKTAKNAFLKIK